MTIILQPPAAPTAGWHERSLCRSEDPDLFFPVGSSVAAQRQIAEAKSVCGNCTVREPCLAWALEHGAEGVWGATDETERRSLLRS